MGNNEGGRTTQDNADILDRSEPARRTPAFGPKPPFTGGGPDAMSAMAADAERIYEEATSAEDVERGPLAASPALIRAYNHVVEALETPGVELESDVGSTLQMAASALARSAAGKRGREELRVLAAGLTARLRKLGYSSSDPAVGILADENPATQSVKAIKAAQARVEELDASVGGMAAMARAGVISETATTVATLMREGTVADEAGEQRRLLKAPAQSLADSVQSLMEHCRALGVELESSQLDLILKGADDVLEAAGKDRRNLLANYYGKRTIAGMSGSRAPGSERLGEGHVKDVIDWLRNGAAAGVLYADIASIVKEPPIKKEPSLFERVLTDAVIGALGQMSTALFKALSGVAGKGAEKMLSKATPPDLSKQETFADIMEIVSAPEPGKAPDKGLFNLATSVGPQLVAPIEEAVKGKISEEVKAGLAAGVANPLSTVFLEQVKEGAIADLAHRFSQTAELEAQLAMLPPAEVQATFAQLKERTTAEAKANLAHLVMRWADFVVKATSGLDAAGTVNQFGGTLETVGDLPGTVQIPLTVTIGAMVRNETLGPVLQPGTSPARRSQPTTFHWGAVHMNGMSPSGLAKLRDANLPMGSAKLHRVYELTVIADGHVLSGKIDVNPEGVVDLSHPLKSVRRRQGRSRGGGSRHRTPSSAARGGLRACSGVRRSDACPD
jgi:hypothetical protein